MKKAISSGLLVPSLCIFAFLLMIVGASYSFYSVSQGSTTGAANIANINMTAPRNCSFSVQTTNCALSSTSSNIFNGNDNIISRGEFINQTYDKPYTYYKRQIATTTCYTNITLTGNQGCHCPFVVSLEPNTGSDIYRHNTGGLYEFYTKFSVNSSSNSSSILGSSYLENNINHLVGGLTSGLLKVNSTGAASSISFKTDMIMYYSPMFDQSFLSGKNFSYKIKAEAGDCNVGKVCKKISGTSLSYGAKYQCTFKDGYVENYYYLGNNSSNSNYADLIAYQNLKEGNTEILAYWCDQNMGYTSYDCSLANHDGLYTYLKNYQNKLGNNVLVGLPTHNQASGLWDYEIQGNRNHFWANGNELVYISPHGEYINGEWESWEPFVYPAYSSDNTAGIRPVITIAKDLLD